MIMIKINYVLSLLLHSLVIFYLLIFFEFNKSKKIYPDSININIQTVPLIKKNEQTYTENNHFPTKIEKKEIEIKKTPKPKNKIIPSEKKINQMKEKEQTIEKHNNIQKEDPRPANTLKNYKIKQREKSENTFKQTFSSKETKIFNNYNDELKALIQKKATQNYPRASLRRNEEGTVEIIFSIDMKGNIFNIKKGTKTNASERLINSAIETLNLISPYKRNNILKKKNTFSIIIVYKLK